MNHRKKSFDEDQFALAACEEVRWHVARFQEEGHPTRTAIALSAEVLGITFRRAWALKYFVLPIRVTRMQMRGIYLRQLAALDRHAERKLRELEEIERKRKEAQAYLEVGGQEDEWVFCRALRHGNFTTGRARVR